MLIFCSLQGSSCGNVQEEPGKYALISAVKTGKLKKVKECLSKGADSNMPDAYGQFPLAWACFYDKKGDVVQALLDAGAKIDTKDKDGWIPLDSAYKALNLSAIHQLVQKAIDLNMLNLRGYDGKTLLHFAALLKGKKGAEMVAQLLKLGADRDVQDNDGKISSDYFDDTVKNSIVLLLGSSTTRNRG